MAPPDGSRLDRHAVRRLAKRAGPKLTSPHSLRHAAIPAALDAGCSLRDVQDYARHADPRQTRRYDGDALLDQLPLEVLVAVDQHLAGVGKVGGELAQIIRDNLDIDRPDYKHSRSSSTTRRAAHFAPRPPSTTPATSRSASGCTACPPCGRSASAPTDVLDVQRTSCDPTIGQDAFASVTRHRIINGQRVAALRFDDPRVLALYHALVSCSVSGPTGSPTVTCAISWRPCSASIRASRPQAL